jgi:hypothetical protein
MQLIRSFLLTLTAMWVLPSPKEPAPCERLPRDPDDRWSRKVVP